jgi:hypothetical protein
MTMLPCWQWGTQWREFFHPLLTPGKHFVAVRPDLSDLVSVASKHLGPGGNHPEVSAALEGVAEAGNRFFWEHLTPAKQLCYLHMLLTRYADIFPPSLSH